MVDFDLICGDAIKELQKMEELKETDRHHIEIFKKIKNDYRNIGCKLTIGWE